MNCDGPLSPELWFLHRKSSITMLAAVNHVHVRRLNDPRTKTWTNYIKLIINGPALFQL